MSRNNEAAKKKGRGGKSFKPQPEEIESEEPFEESAMIIFEESGNNRKPPPSLGGRMAAKFHRRMEAAHQETMNRYFRKSGAVVEDIKEDPEILQRLDMWRQKAAHNLLLRQQAGLEKFSE